MGAYTTRCWRAWEPETEMDVEAARTLLGTMWTIRAFEDHGEVARTIDDDVEAAKRTMDAVARAGVDYDDVVATLEREGVQKFADSFQELAESVAASLRGAVSR